MWLGTFPALVTDIAQISTPKPVPKPVGKFPMKHQIISVTTYGNEPGFTCETE